MIGVAAWALAAATPLTAQLDAIVARRELAGEVLVARDGVVLLDKGYGALAPGGKARHRAGARWRLASITKQVVATLVMRDVDAGRYTLDAPVAPLLGAPGLGTATVRQLLTHRSGLRNPDATPAGADGVPAFYKAAAPDLGYCETAPTGSPGGAFAYNNCDYVVLGALLERTAAKPLAALLPAGLKPARAGMALVPGFVGGKPEPAISLPSFGASGALTGTAAALLGFDRRLIAGGLLSPAARAELWKGDPKLGYQALGQWVFPGRLQGCAAPKTIVQRDGEIYGVQTRNFILPDDGLVVIVLTNRSSDDIAFGEVWQGKGLAFELLSAAACS